MEQNSKYQFRFNPDILKYVLHILFIVVNVSSYAQSENKLKRLNDSLIMELELSHVDSVKAGIMIQTC